jgi:8-oxoguanine deaminase
MDDAGRELTNTTIEMRDGWISGIGHESLEGKCDQVIDARHLIAIPGLVNTHHHLYQTLTRGFPESEGMTLFPWLQTLYPTWAGLDEQMIYASTRTGLAELALSGCTTSSDHLYVFPDGSEAFMDAQVEAARSIGLRFHATRGSMDLGVADGGLPPDSVVQPLETILRDCERAIDRFHDGAPGAMTRIGLAPCSPFSVTPELMRESAMLARSKGVLLHTHIAETLDEDAYSREAFGLSPVELLDSVGWAASDVWVAHCVHPTESDVDLLAERDVAVAHCPTSNMLLSSGLAPVAEYRARDIRVGLGVDGSASNDANDLGQEVKQALLVARVRDGVNALSARDALRLGTRGGASCLGREDIGSIEVGKAADIALFDSESIALAGSQEDLVAGLVLGAPRPVIVIVNGVVIVRGGNLVSVEAEDIVREHNAAAGRLMSKARETTHSRLH